MILISLFPKRTVNSAFNMVCKSKHLRRYFSWKKCESAVPGKYFSQQSIYLVDETKHDNDTLHQSDLNKYTNRTATCGELTIAHLGQQVTITGWLEFNRMNKFLVLRDSYGQTQLILRDGLQQVQKKINNLSYESVIQVRGTVIARPKDMVNKKQATGEIEVDVEDLVILNAANKLPFNIREYQKANEALRLQFSYLGLRFFETQRNLRFRSEFCINLREFLAKQCGFVEVETPTLFKATPGGAQEFVVPTRHKNKYYSLVQSPQQFKQMLICGGIDRYFQIARCYRDETSRPDRQPEFTQLDIELANTSVDGVIELIEDTLQYSLPSNLQPISKKFKRMRYKDAIENYGSDKPDTRFKHTIVNVTEILKSSLGSYHQGDAFYAGCLVFDDGKHGIKIQNCLKSNAEKEFPNTRMLHIKCRTYDDFKRSIEKIIKHDTAIQVLYDNLNFKNVALVFLVYGNRNSALKRLGKLRNLSAEDLNKQGTNIYEPGLHFLWIVNFPLFFIGDNGELSAQHHPFTSPHIDDINLLDVDPLKVRALSYDLVLNGYEVGGGSIRIHDPKLQQKILKMLNIAGLDHIVEMLSYGCPPHGGVALGLDRLISRILNTQSIRDVIAFPKTFDGKDPISGAPTMISDKSKAIYHL